MKLVVDTDAFCKLGIAGLVEEATKLLGADLSECHRLPALPHMLRRGRLRKRLGEEHCDALIALADSLNPLEATESEWLDRFAQFPAIDPGEAQILSHAVENQSLFVLSGDKRALQALAEIPSAPELLSGRIVTVEAILIALCATLGAEEVRHCVAPIRDHDKTVKVCFSSGNQDPTAALQSYFDDLESKVAPLVLWKPGDTK